MAGIAAATLKSLGLDGSAIDRLKKVSYPDLITAGNAALRSVAQASGRRNPGWDVIAGGQYVMREFCDRAEDIPLMPSTVFSGMAGNLTKGDGPKNEWSEKEIDEQLAKEYGDRKGEIVAEFQKAFPRKMVQDVLYFANTSRSPVRQILSRKLGEGQDAGPELSLCL